MKMLTTKNEDGNNEADDDGNNVVDEDEHGSITTIAGKKEIHVLYYACTNRQSKIHINHTTT